MCQEMEIFVAMLDTNQGIAYQKELPWPYLRGDHEFYISRSTSLKDPNKKVAYIMGRDSWEAWTDDERCHPHIFTVVTSTTLRSDGIPFLQKVLPTLVDAINYVTSPPVGDIIEKVVIMGGNRNYTESLEDPRLKRIWVTRVFGQFKADVFFPKFQHKFRRAKCKTLDENMQEDNGVKYQFELWERFTN